MALRAFLTNPSIGGFGGESSMSLPEPQPRSGRQPDTTGTDDVGTRTTARTLFSHEESVDNDVGENSCDAFAAIVKELVDNAVDACASPPDGNTTMNGNDHDLNEEKIMKRVRVIISEAIVPVSNNGKSSISSNSHDDGSKTMNCLRIEVSDNGCGMEDIDYCVSVFSSNKSTVMKKSTDVQAIKTSGKKCKSKSKTKPVLDLPHLPSPNSEKFTSGRYGVGLTLCLLHAQRLIPGTGACITSATATSVEWIRATYEPDTDADNIVCKKKERFPKVVGESGTTISLFVPGGESARRAWPRLAEYFARFQLSTDLPCSLEVKAPMLQSIPLYIRPAAEIERRMKKNSKPSLSTDEKSIEDKWEGDDGFDEGLSRLSLDDGSNCQAPQMTNADRKRIEVEMQRMKKLSLIHRAAAAYKRRPDLKLDNVAHSTQPIRRSGGCQYTTSANGSVLEVSLIVFGPDIGDNEDRHDVDTNSSKLRVVRMVNGIPLLDSPEALACGIMRKVSSSASTWNSFGLEVMQNNEHGLEFAVQDSSQVAPFLRDLTHSLFEEHRRGNNQSSDDEAEVDGDEVFDAETSRVKRKTKCQRKGTLPAALRLGHVLMVVQIRAKPSALPLPTLSKGRLPLNDKGISDALLNGISDCLRSLQRSSPGLLLTAHQLRKVERDVKYIPAITSAMASVLGRSDRGTYARVLRRAAAWENNGGISDMASEDELESTERIPIARAPVETNEERLRIDALQRAIEKRLRLIVSDEYKSSKIANEKELHRKNREDLATTKKRAKTSNVGDGDHLEIDCFDSDDDNSSSGESAEANTGIDNNPDDASYGSVSFGNNICQQSQGGSSTSSSSPSNVEHLLDRGRPSNSESGKNLAIVNDSSNCSLKAGSSYDFDDGYESSH